MYCKICKSKIGELIRKRDEKFARINKFCILRVDSRRYGNVCEPFDDLDQPHAHRYFVISSNSIATDQPCLPVDLSVKNEGQLVGGVCPYSDFLAVVGSSSEARTDKSDCNKVSEFIRAFLVRLENEPSSTKDMYSMSSIKKALEDAQTVSMVPRDSKFDREKGEGPAVLTDVKTAVCSFSGKDVDELEEKLVNKIQILFVVAVYSVR